jgi:hypothetical protein
MQGNVILDQRLRDAPLEVCCVAPPDPDRQIVLNRGREPRGPRGQDRRDCHRRQAVNAAHMRYERTMLRWQSESRG